ncbi:unnamed protein product [Colias eurytheme]|nr:unnamed protein product [Colias eurytheme]
MSTRCCIFFVLFHFSYALWKGGVIHYTINNKDYDLHSQDEIVSTFSKIQEETCLKFFMTTSNNTSDKILFISNPNKLKTCLPNVYDYSKSVVLMPIGYKCVNQRDIARIVYDMIKASIENIVSPVNSYDLVKKFQMKYHDNVHDKGSCTRCRHRADTAPPPRLYAVYTFATAPPPRRRRTATASASLDFTIPLYSC